MKPTVKNGKRKEKQFYEAERFSNRYPKQDAFLTLPALIRRSALICLSRSNSLSNNFANKKNEYGKKYIQSAVLRERQQGEKRHCPHHGTSDNQRDCGAVQLQTKCSLTMAGLSLRLTCDLLGNGSRSSLRSCSKGYTDLYHRKGKTGE